MKRRRLPDGMLPSFVFPSELTFFVDDKDSHKQVLTVYNPYDFPLRFKIKCTAPDKYLVKEGAGTLHPLCCVDIVIHHLSISPSSLMIRDKFRVELYESLSGGRRQMVGRKEVPAVLLPHSGHLDTKGHPTQDNRATPFRNVSRLGGGDGGGTNLVVVMLLAACCVLVLLLPLKGEPSSLPDYLHLSLHFKLAAAYFLGLTTMVILRQ